MTASSQGSAAQPSTPILATAASGGASLPAPASPAAASDQVSSPSNSSSCAAAGSSPSPVIGGGGGLGVSSAAGAAADASTGAAVGVDAPAPAVGVPAAAGLACSAGVDGSEAGGNLGVGLLGEAESTAERVGADVAVLGEAADSRAAMAAAAVPPAAAGGPAQLQQQSLQEEWGATSVMSSATAAGMPAVPSPFAALAAAEYTSYASFEAAAADAAAFESAAADAAAAEATAEGQSPEDPLVTLLQKSSVPLDATIAEVSQRIVVELLQPILSPEVGVHPPSPFHFVADFPVAAAAAASAAAAAAGRRIRGAAGEAAAPTAAAVSAAVVSSSSLETAGSCFYCLSAPCACAYFTQSIRLLLQQLSSTTASSPTSSSAAHARGATAAAAGSSTPSPPHHRKRQRCSSAGGAAAAPAPATGPTPAAEEANAAEETAASAEPTSQESAAELEALAAAAANKVSPFATGLSTLPPPMLVDTGYLYALLAAAASSPAAGSSDAAAAAEDAAAASTGAGETGWSPRANSVVAAATSAAREAEQRQQEQQTSNHNDKNSFADAAAGAAGGRRSNAAAAPPATEGGAGCAAGGGQPTGAAAGTEGQQPCPGSGSSNSNGATAIELLAESGEGVGWELLKEIVESFEAIWNTISMESIEDRMRNVKLPYDPYYPTSYLEWRSFLLQKVPTGASVSRTFGRQLLRSLLLASSEVIIKDILRTPMAFATAILFHRLAEEAAIPFDTLVALWQSFAPNRHEAKSHLVSESGLGFLSRDLGSAKEEEAGVITFKCVTNDRLPFSSISLVTMKNIFSRQLPKMPREYIVRLVFDRNHYTFCLLKANTIIGGCCFRPYFQQRFAEIAFLAVTSTEQVKGYGTRLMNHLKEHVKKSGIEYFLTYADNFAVGYFRKQGFTQKISMPRERWYGYIKDYEGGTLMECYVNPKIDYLRLSEMLHDQQQVVKRAILTLKPLAVYPGLDFWQQHPGERLSPALIPGLVENGWRPGEATAAGQHRGGGAAAAAACDRDGRTDGAAAAAGPGGPAVVGRGAAAAATGGSGRGTGDGFMFGAAGEGNAAAAAGAAGGAAGVAAGAGAAPMLASYAADEEQQEPIRPLHEMIMDVLEALGRHHSAWPFLKPVSRDEAPDYYDVISHPTDIQTMKKKCRKKQYTSPEAFIEEVHLMFRNCRQYNHQQTIYFKYANELEKFVTPKLLALKQLFEQQQQLLQQQLQQAQHAQQLQHQQQLQLQQQHQLQLRGGGGGGGGGTSSCGQNAAGASVVSQAENYQQQQAV